MTKIGTVKPEGCKCTNCSCNPCNCAKAPERCAPSCGCKAK